MAQIEKSITIQAPLETIFAYINEPADMLEIWPSMIEVKDVHDSPLGGKNFRWVYKMTSVRFAGSSEVLEHVPNERIVVKTKSDIGLESTITFSFQRTADGTRVGFSANYNVPPLLKLTEPFIVKQNDGEAQLLLENLKVRMEA